MVLLAIPTHPHGVGENSPNLNYQKFCYGCFRPGTTTSSGSSPNPTKTSRPLLQCQKCQIALFCGRDCQKTAWTYHKRSCVGNEVLASENARIATLDGVVDCLHELQTVFFRGERTGCHTFALLLNRIRTLLIKYYVVEGKSGFGGGFFGFGEDGGIIILVGRWRIFLCTCTWLYIDGGDFGFRNVISEREFHLRRCDFVPVSTDHECDSFLSGHQGHWGAVRIRILSASPPHPSHRRFLSGHGRARLRIEAPSDRDAAELRCFRDQAVRIVDGAWRTGILAQQVVVMSCGSAPTGSPGLFGEGVKVRMWELDNWGPAIGKMFGDFADWDWGGVNGVAELVVVCVTTVPMDIGWHDPAQQHGGRARQLAARGLDGGRRETPAETSAETRQRQRLRQRFFFDFGSDRDFRGRGLLIR